MSFHGFPCDSMPMFLAGSRRFFIYSRTRLFFGCFQKVQCFWDVYNEPKPSQLFENWYTFPVCCNIESGCYQSTREEDCNFWKEEMGGTNFLKWEGGLNDFDFLKLMIWVVTFFLYYSNWMWYELLFGSSSELYTRLKYAYIVIVLDWLIDWLIHTLTSLMASQDVL